MNRRQRGLLEKLCARTKLGEQLELLEELIVIENVNRNAILEVTKWQDYYFRHMVRLIHKLVPEVRYLIGQDKINFSMARAIASLPNAKQEDAARSAIAKMTSVHQFRLSLKSNNNSKLIQQLNRLSDLYSARTGLDINIVADKNCDISGSWIIRYHDLDMFDVITEKIIGVIDRD